MASATSTSSSGKPRPELVPLKYGRFVESITAADGPQSTETKIRALKRFEALKSFLNLDGYANQGVPEHISQPSITVVTLSATSGLLFHDVSIDQLSTVIEEDKFQLFIVENITPEAIRVLGGYLRVDPQFFLDYIHAMPADFDVTKEEQNPRPDIIPTPWYRLQSLEGHLPMLRSLRADCDYIQLDFIGPSQYDKSDNRNARERMRPDLKRMNVERIAGLQVPIARKTGPGGTQFNNVAMARHCVSMWFQKPDDPKQPRWTKGIILIDPPFEVDDPGEKEYGKRLPSIYRSFVARPLPFELGKKDWDIQSTYKNSLIHYMRDCLKLQQASDFHPILVAQGLARIVASEWIATNGYMERDLNTMEWELESTKVGIDVLEKFLSRLFVHRRRIGKYAQLVDEQMLLFQKCMPAAWTVHLSDAVEQALQDMQQDASHVHVILRRNSERVAQAVDLIMSIISLRESEESVKQNDTLRFLTLVSVFVLPFNAVAAILGIQTIYGPGNESFWMFWAMSFSAWGAIWVVYGLAAGAKNLSVTKGLKVTCAGNARAAGLEVDIGIAEGDYQMALTIFFISYAVTEPLTNALLKRAFVLGMVVGWGNLNGVVFSNIYLDHEKPRYWTGHGVILAYQAVFLLGGTVFMHFGLKKLNRDRRAGKLDARWNSLSEEQRWIEGDLRPDFVYTT